MIVFCRCCQLSRAGICFTHWTRYAIAIAICSSKDLIPGPVELQTCSDMKLACFYSSIFNVET